MKFEVFPAGRYCSCPTPGQLYSKRPCLQPWPVSPVNSLATKNPAVNVCATAEESVFSPPFAPVDPRSHTPALRFDIRRVTIRPIVACIRSTIKLRKRGSVLKVSQPRITHIKGLPLLGALGRAQVIASVMSSPMRQGVALGLSESAEARHLSQSHENRSHIPTFDDRRANLLGDELRRSLSTSQLRPITNGIGTGDLAVCE